MCFLIGKFILRESVFEVLRSDNKADDDSSSDNKTELKTKPVEVKEVGCYFSKFTMFCFLSSFGV